MGELQGIAMAISGRLEGLSNRRARAEADVPSFIRGLLRFIESTSHEFDGTIFLERTAIAEFGIALGI